MEAQSLVDGIAYLIYDITCNVPLLYIAIG